MKKLIILTIFLFPLISYSKNTITINRKKVKVTEEVKEIFIQNNGILIQGISELMCFLPFEKIAKDVTKSSHCATCKDEYTERDRFSDMFKFATDAKISCELKEDEVIGFNFVGSTVQRGEGAFVSYGNILNMEVYKTDFREEQKPGALDNTIRKVEKVLLKLFF